MSLKTSHYPTTFGTPKRVKLKATYEHRPKAATAFDVVNDERLRNRIDQIVAETQKKADEMKAILQAIPARALAWVAEDPDLHPAGLALPERVRGRERHVSLHR